MNVHYTGRHQEVTPFVRKLVDTRLNKLAKILGPRPALETHVVLAYERYLFSVEITVNLRDNALIGVAETPRLRDSVREALDRLEKQVLRQKSRWRVKNRHTRPVAARSIRTLAAKPERAA